MFGVIGDWYNVQLETIPLSFGRNTDFVFLSKSKEYSTVVSEW